MGDTFPLTYLLSRAYLLTRSLTYLLAYLSTLPTYLFRVKDVASTTAKPSASSLASYMAQSPPSSPQVLAFKSMTPSPPSTRFVLNVDQNEQLRAKVSKGGTLPKIPQRDPQRARGFESSSSSLKPERVSS